MHSSSDCHKEQQGVQIHSGTAMVVVDIVATHKVFIEVVEIDVVGVHMPFVGVVHKPFKGVVGYNHKEGSEVGDYAFVIEGVLDMVEAF
jgi:hypothetical protein